MKKVILLRHGKSDWDAPWGDDHERPLARRGQRAAELVGRFLSATGELPQAVVTSSAVRARTTVETAAAAGGWQCPVRVRRDLYGAAPEVLLSVIHDADEDADTLLLAGHEPVWSQTASRLVGGGSLRVVTAALVCVGFEVESWAEVEFGRGTLLWLVPPKLLQRAGLS